MFGRVHGAKRGLPQSVDLFVDTGTPHTPNQPPASPPPRSLEVQPGNRYGATEPNTLLHTLVAQLTTGPVSPSDAVGLSNATLIAITHRPDGLLLRPDAPAVTIDAAIVAAKANGGALPYVTRAHTELGGFRWFFVLAADLTAPFDVVPSTLGPTAAGVTAYAVVDWLGVAPVAVVPATARYTLPTGQGWPHAGPKAIPFRYVVFAPVLPASGWALLGELAKGVPVASQRLSNFASTASGFSVDVASADGEAPVVLSARSPGGAVVTASCDGGGARRTLTCGPAGCACNA